MLVVDPVLVTLAMLGSDEWIPLTLELASHLALHRWGGKKVELFLYIRFHEGFHLGGLLMNNSCQHIFSHRFLQRPLKEAHRAHFSPLLKPSMIGCVHMA